MSIGFSKIFFSEISIGRAKSFTFSLVFYINSSSFFILCLVKLLLFVLFFTRLSADLMNDLIVVDYWNQRTYDRMPVTYNHLLYAGYWNMPSARMSCEGILGAGFSYVPPYHNYNLYCQLTPFLEISGNYRVFKGVDDPILTPLGFGDMSDKGANFKIAIFKPEDSDYKLPGLAVGWEDFMGTRNFKAKYLVLTKVFIDEDLEVSLGIGAERIRRWFGGTCWIPFRRSSCSWLQPLSLVAEYDATPYKSERIEKHPKGRSQKSKINWGLKYRLFDTFDFSVSYIRGKKLAASVAAFYDFGHTEGFMPKIDDSLPYMSPIIREPLGPLRTQNGLVNDLAFAFEGQGIELLKVEMGFECNEKILRLRIYNDRYEEEAELRERLNCLLSRLIPQDIDQVIVVIDAEGFPIQEYHYRVDSLIAYADGEIGSYELSLLTPLHEVQYHNALYYSVLFDKTRESMSWFILPKTHTFFGSSKGKFKYSLGVSFGIDGFLPTDIYYSIALGWNAISNLYDLNDTDRLNPSQIINVRSDIVRYYQQKGLTVDEAYLQKCWNMGHACYSRIAGGYFEEEYAGLATELLYYPVHSSAAVGIEGALFKKRAYRGLGFTSHVRKLDGFVPTWKNFSFGSQYFINFYYDWCAAQLEVKLKIGKFLAGDYGIRTEVSRYFESGLRVSFWYTVTNGHDRINGKTYYDKGVAFSLPLDLFYTESSRKRWNYGMSAWLRDVGVIAATGQDLFELINEQRQ